MGNALTEPKKKTLTIHDLAVKVGEYKSIQEGDPEMREDPEFPLHMMYEALDNNNTIEGNAVQGTYVYYPNKDKPKMWIGNYKIMNPEDILCKDVAAKIGMSEDQWKKYIEEKKNGKSMSGEYTDFDFLPKDQKDALNHATKNGLFEFPFDHNNKEKQINELGFNENMQKYLNLYNNDISNLSELNGEPILDHNMSDTKNDSLEHSQDVYEEYTGDIKDIQDYNSYIEKLNAESSRIREAQEQDIFQQQKKILYYSNINLGNGTMVTTELDQNTSQNDMMPFEFSQEEKIEYTEDVENVQMDEQNELANVESKSPESIHIKKKLSPPKKQIAKLTPNEIEQKIPHEKKEKEEAVKAKVNSFRKKNCSNYKVEMVTKKTRSNNVKSLTSMSTKSSLGMNKSKIITNDKSKNLKNTTMKKLIQQT